MTNLSEIKQELKNLADPKRAENSQRFFKTAKGEYGEGDIFLGINLPTQRKVAQKFKNLELEEVKKLLQSKIHEERLVSLLILIQQYEKGDETTKKKLYEFYLTNAKRINNWDLVDVSAPKIVGDYLLTRPKKILYQLAKSDNLWEKRIAIVSTWMLIRNNQLNDTLKIAEILLNDQHDLIHKAVGWMLREVGKRDQILLENFLKKYSKKMPRTMLRYAIEKFDKEKRKFYMQK